jgi:hypothetical protein
MQMQGWIEGWRSVWLKKFWIVWRNGRRARSFEAGPEIIFAGGVVDSFVYRASGRSVVGEHVSLGDERRLVQPKGKSSKPPHSKRIRIHYWMPTVHWWSQSQVSMMNRLAMGVLLRRASNGELHIQAGRAPSAAPTQHAVQPDRLIATGIKGALRIELIATGLGSAGLIAAGWVLLAPLA